MVLETQKITVGDIVCHKSKEDEMLVLAVNKRWITSEYADSEGERVEKVYDKEFLVIVRKKKPLITDLGLKMSYGY